MTQQFDEETLLWLEEERPDGEGSQPNKKIAAIAGGVAGTAMLGKALGPVAKKLSKKTGIPASQIQALLTVSAPIVVSAVSAAVAKRKQAAQQAKTVPGEIVREDGEAQAKEAHGLLGHVKHRH